MAEIVPSPELLAVARRVHRAARETSPRVIRNLLSTSEHLRFVSTAEEEVCSGRVVREGLAQHYGELPDHEDEELLGEAFECGPAGWAFFVRRLRWLHTGESSLVRYTLVFAMEDGMWRVVRRRTSIPRSNQELFGGGHSALQGLAEEAERSGALLGRSGLTAVMFTDVVGSTQLAAEAGDAAWAARIRAHFRTVADAAVACGGEVVKTLGDGAVSVFGSAREAVRAAAVVRAAAEAEKGVAPLVLRIGVDAGDVTAAAADVFGMVVNRAARIAASAPPGAIRVSEAMHALAGDVDGLRVGEPSPVPLKGVEGTPLLREVFLDA